MKYIVLFSLFCSALFGNLFVSVDKVESRENAGLITYSLENKSDQTIKSARAWIFLFDESGKVVGTHAEWIIGGEKSDKTLDSEAKQTFSTNVKSKEKIASAQVTFSRIVLENGSMPNPQKFVKQQNKKESEG